MRDKGIRFFTKEQRNWRRVAFISHALLPGYRSTELISGRLAELGVSWPERGMDPGWIRWFSFPVIPPKSDMFAVPVWVDFYLIPVLAPDYLAVLKSGQAYLWAEAAALYAAAEAHMDGVSLTIGWGAGTKNATRHGEMFLEKNPEMISSIHTTHGDAGTASLVMSAIELAGFKPGFRVAVIGANGVIGDAISRLLVDLDPSSIMLVGKPDKEGENKNLNRLNGLAGRVLERTRKNTPLEVLVHQDKKKACVDHESDLVIVATTGMDLSPSDIPRGALVLDATAPSACSPHPDWSDHRLVLSAGCGQFQKNLLPEGFGVVKGRKTLTDVGAGGEYIFWGCAGEAIVGAVYGRIGHIVGTDIPIKMADWCGWNFHQLGFSAQPPVSFGQEMSWDEVRRFVESDGHC